MPGSFVLRGLASGLVLFALSSSALAQSDDHERTTGYNAIIDNIDLLVDNYARFLGRKYDLTEEQDAYTKSLLRERSYEFLDQHEAELRELVDRMFDVRTGGEMTAQELIEWGRGVRPIYEDAKRLIVDGNDEWREILTAEQRRTHDADLKLMYQSFETTEEQLTRIISGEMTVDEFRSPQRGRRRHSRPRANKPLPPRDEPPYGREPPPPPDRPTRLSPPPRHEKLEPPPAEPAVGETVSRVTRPAPEDKPPPPAKAAEPRAERFRSEPGARETKPRGSRGRHVPTKPSSKGSESAWEKYVREFIAKYKLNDEQSQKANAVLEECKSQRDRYLRARQGQIEQIDGQIAELKKSKDKNKAKRLAQLTDKRQAVMEPVEKIFEQQLKPRLERLPTRAQRRAAEAAAKKPAAKKTSRNQKTTGSKGKKGD
ncbi:MAG: hypothetical protein ACE5I3_04645 [Phycisphaerae bacterium]